MIIMKKIRQGKQEKTTEVAKLNQAVASMKQELMNTTIKHR